jgi:hypothetical protein
MIAAAHDVIDSTRILDPKFASHPRTIDLSDELSILLTDPFTSLHLHGGAATADLHVALVGKGI